jgi:CRISPR system Cascade subunit CasE
MYLTRLRLEPRSAQARRDLSDAYQMHKSLTRAFAADEASKPERFLWRLETMGHDWSNPIVLVQSNQVADWSSLEARPQYLKQPAETKALAPEQFIQAEADYRFRLLANPTVTRDGKRYGLASEDEQLAWLARQGEKHGFDLKAVWISSSDIANMRKASMSMQVQRTGFEGVLHVLQSDLLIQALAAGVGPAKAFGCGLLSLARC